MERTNLINPPCLRIQEKSLRNVEEFFHWSLRQASTRLECDIQLVSPEGRSRKGAVVTEDSAALKYFPRLSLFSHWLVVVTTTNIVTLTTLLKMSLVAQLQIVRGQTEDLDRSLKSFEVALFLYFSVSHSLSLQERGRLELLLRAMTLASVWVDLFLQQCESLQSPLRSLETAHQELRSCQEVCFVQDIQCQDKYARI